MYSRPAALHSQYPIPYTPHLILLFTGFNGTIHVVPLADIAAPLTIKVNSDPINLPPSIICGAPPQNFDHYMFAVSHTPLVSDTFSGVFSYQDENSVQVSGLATTSEHNLFTIGGKACSMSGQFSTNLVQPDYSGPADNTISYSSMERSVGCEMDLVEPGVYRPILHVAGRGRGLVLDSAIVDVVPTYGPAQLHDPSGSLRGGTLLEIDARGLSEDDITKLRVEIGNTPCLVQQIDPSNHNHIYCITEPARDDGYSSLVHSLHPVGYWTLQTDYFNEDGGYVGSDGETVYRNVGSVGRGGDGRVRGEVVGREEGISGNTLTNQAALFNNSYIEVPFHSDFAQPAGFGMGLWIKAPALEGDPETSAANFLAPQLSPGSGDPLPGSGEGDISQGVKGPYRILVDFASLSDGVAHGYVIVINPCDQLEFWLASVQSIATFSGAEDCPTITSDDCASPAVCSGYSVVSMAMTYGNLPPGVWSVIRCGDCNLTEWSLVSVGWTADSEDCEELCAGQQVLHFNDRFIDTMATTHSAQTNRSLLIGGTDRLLLGGDSDLSNSPLTGFVGHVDEVSVFDRPMSASEAEEHFEYGSTEKQKVWIRVESVDGISTGQDLEPVLEWNGAFEEVQSVDWNTVSGEVIEIADNIALRFSWTR